MKRPLCNCVIKPLLIFFVLCSSALATKVWYGDSEGKSANGRWVATARSPENRKKNPRPFARDFTFSLKDTTTGKVLWRYNGGRDSEPAGALFVSDSGAVISIGAHHGLSLFRLSGQRIKLPGVLDLLPKNEVERYCNYTTAGTFWSQFSWNGFILVGKSEFFYVRTYWGRVLLVNIERGEISSDREAKRVVGEYILGEARKALTIPKEQYWERCSGCKGMHLNAEIKRSVFVLVQHNESGRGKLIKLINETDDGHMFDAKDFLARLKGE